MAATDATAFPIRGQAYRITGAILDVTTGQTLTTLGTLAATASLDGAAFAATGLTIAELDTSGFFTLDIDATRMTADTIALKVTEDTSNSTDWTCVINPLNMAEFTGRADARTIKRFESYVQQALEYLTNLFTRNKNTGLMTMYKADGTTAIMTATDSNVDQTVTKGRLS